LTSEDRAAAAASLFLTQKFDFNPQVNICHPLHIITVQALLLHFSINTYFWPQKQDKG